MRLRKPSPGREKLLASAAALFAANGFDGTSTKHLAADAGLSIGALYHHFQTKAAAYEAALVWGLSRIDPPADVLGEASEQLDAQVRWFCSVIAAQTIESQLLRLELLDPHLPRGLTELEPFAQSFARFKSLMAEVAPGSDAEEAVAAIVSLSFGFARLGGLKQAVPGFAKRTADPEMIAVAAMRIVLGERS